MLRKKQGRRRRENRGHAMFREWALTLAFGTAIVSFLALTFIILPLGSSDRKQGKGRAKAFLKRLVHMEWGVKHGETEDRT